MKIRPVVWSVGLSVILKKGKAKGQSGVFWCMRRFGVGDPIHTKFRSSVGLMDLAKYAKDHGDYFIRFCFIEV